MNSNFDNISYYHKEILLRTMSYHMSQDLRRILMRECPAAYNALCGRTVITSQIEDNGDTVISR